ncbi:hypothetical protein [Aquicella lusitana]|uniref:hypothetical protein n=1 Tax=Aquicella lusitana TaxID=254246 RepID=UPI001474C386|nr:hypothetical protein [Aquicella lusitana]
MQSKKMSRKKLKVEGSGAFHSIVHSIFELLILGYSILFRTANLHSFVLSLRWFYGIKHSAGMRKTG